MTYAEPDAGTSPEDLAVVRRPRVVALDVNETLSDVTALGAVFEQVGLPATAASQWLTKVLRDGFALALAGDNRPFADVAAAGLPREVTDRAPAARDEIAARVVGALAELPLHPDVVPGLRALRELDVRVVTLSNGAPSVARGLLTAAGAADLVQAYLSVQDAPGWKPGWQAYAWAAEQCNVPVGALLLVSVHPWDVHGAAGAGARTAWVNRTGASWPAIFTRPDLRVASLTELAQVLTG